MTYQEILQRLNPVYGTGEARAIARLVLEERFGLSLTDIIFGKVNELSRENSQELEKIIVRLENSEPVQYILGYQDFCGHRFHVAPGVLIPRPETELLTPLTTIDGITHGADNPDFSILDIGTGSGCIAISWALAYPDAHVEGWDISPDALRIAQGNAESLGAKNVTFRHVDILDEHTIPADMPSGGWKAIVSNPPYICRSEAADMEQNVLEHEPDTALFVPDDDPLLFYRAIAQFGTRSLANGGMLLFEINRAYGQDICGMLRSLGYSDIQLIKDQFDNDRIVTGIFSPDENTLIND